MPERDYKELYRKLPATERLLASEEVLPLIRSYGREAVKVQATASLDALRGWLAQNAGSVEKPGPGAELDERIGNLPRVIDMALAERLAPRLRRVINATGVLLHTNLGRAPLASAWLARAATLASGYVNLEYRLASGERGDRNELVAELAVAALGGEAALVVNNNAAAVLLAANSLALGKTVLVSRGELVEIGGSFRLPEILASAGVTLREVGTTNRTHLEDYRAPLAAGVTRVGAILRVHPSNYRIEGFTTRPEMAALAALAREYGVPLVVDQGSGAPGILPAILDVLSSSPAGEEPLSELWRAGADLVCASGDKLLGGPQAGIILGKLALIERLARNPLARALRPDKVTYILLAEHLAEILRSGWQAIPLAALATASIADLGRRAAAIGARFAGGRLAGSGLKIRVVETSSTLGGGTTPGLEIPSRALEVCEGSPAGRSAAALHSALRQGNPPVVGRIENDVLFLDLRAVFPAEDEDLVLALGALGTRGGEK